jgi:ribonucleoside-diphosphate reductase alpha chain
MTARRRLANRRASETFSFDWLGMEFTATISRFPDGSLAEIFLTNHKTGSHADTAARDSAVVASLALQHGTPVETLRRALLRDSQGNASGPLGVALDTIAGEAVLP